MRKMAACLFVSSMLLFPGCNGAESRIAGSFSEKELVKESETDSASETDKRLSKTAEKDAASRTYKIGDEVNLLKTIHGPEVTTSEMG